jgi:hypothetical protein
MKKGLVNIIASLSLLGLSACNNAPEYHFNGEIGEEKVHFYETPIDSPFKSGARLEITRLNGNRIIYATGDDLKLDRVYITIEDNTTSYGNKSSNEKVKETLAEGQIKFDEYLDKIHEIQTAPITKN